MLLVPSGIHIRAKIVLYDNIPNNTTNKYSGNRTQTSYGQKLDKERRNERFLNKKSKNSFLRRDIAKGNRS